MPSTQNLTAQNINLTGCSVLVVDDNEAVRHAMCRLLKHHGIAVDNAHSGLTALESLKSKDYDVMLVDVQMPDMSGLELTQALRKTSHPDLKIIGISAGALGDDRQLCLEAGMNDYLSKPFKVNHMLEKIRLHIGKRDDTGS